jgi:hypothetical protein
VIGSWSQKLEGANKIVNSAVCGRKKVEKKAIFRPKKETWKVEALKKL